MYLAGYHSSHDDTQERGDPGGWVASISNDEDTLHGLYLHYFPKIYNFVYARLKNRSDADDVTSEVFLKMTEHIDTYDSNRGAFPVWLFSIARTTLLNFYKRRNIHAEVTWEEFMSQSADEAKEPENSLLASEEARAVLMALDKLNPRERRYLEMKFWGELTNRQIAALDGVSESQVGVTVFRALRKLREWLG